MKTANHEDAAGKSLMRTRLLAVTSLVFFHLGNLTHCAAATLYVWAQSPSPSPPYTNMSGAARTIQDAVDAAQAGDTVLVTNGIYRSGGRPRPAPLVINVTNRVMVAKPITVREARKVRFDTGR